MGDLSELETRIRAALERIDAGLDHLPPPGAGEEIARLQAELKATRAELAEARAARDEIEAELFALQSPMPAANDALLRQLDAQSLDNQRLRTTVAALREELRRLTEALTEALADPGLINHALATEVEALRAQHGSETVEMADILAELDRIVTAEEERSHA